MKIADYFRPASGQVQERGPGCSRSRVGRPAGAPRRSSEAKLCIGAHARSRVPRRMKMAAPARPLPRRGSGRSPRDAHSVQRFWQSRAAIFKAGTTRRVGHLDDSDSACASRESREPARDWACCRICLKAALTSALRRRITVPLRCRAGRVDAPLKGSRGEGSSFGPGAVARPDVLEGLGERELASQPLIGVNGVPGSASGGSVTDRSGGERGVTSRGRGERSGLASARAPKASRFLAERGQPASWSKRGRVDGAPVR
jgi:hypothetical protein